MCSWSAREGERVQQETAQHRRAELVVKKGCGAVGEQKEEGAGRGGSRGKRERDRGEGREGRLCSQHSLQTNQYICLSNGCSKPLNTDSPHSHKESFQ